ncbi:MAG: M20/M25/M40 family metallo-hydrolase [Desulfobacteraceae bacterium]|nr:M20/M25/M40 family metallo-hydrolase [Desulfobacteraceae bacterium]
MMKLDGERLAALFTTLCEIDSPSRRESRVAAFLRDLFAREFQEAMVSEDQSGAATGSDSGNLLVRFEGALPLAPVFFCCHMDTVQPGEGVRVRRGGALFTSGGETVLGGDDKSGIAALIEVMRTLRDASQPHGPVEFVFTTCEEIGLLGAKHFDPSRLRASMGYALDSTGTNQVIIGAPAANKIEATIKGLAAHAGLNPEKGIDAIRLAAAAVAAMPLGRLDEESTANVGLISGGTATNIVPEAVSIKGEVRSHDEAKLEQYTRRMEGLFTDVVAGWRDPAGLITARPSLAFEVYRDYPALRLTREDEVVRRVEAASGRLGRQLSHIVSGGGSDANIFNGYGLKTAILGTGMQKVHTTSEQISLDDMLQTAALVYMLIS